MVFQCINICQVPWAFGLSFQHLPWDLANVNAWKTMFVHYSSKEKKKDEKQKHLPP